VGGGGGGGMVHLFFLSFAGWGECAREIHHIRQADGERLLLLAHAATGARGV